MKNEIRKKFKEKRRLMEKSEVLEKSRFACEAFLKSEMYKNTKTLMLYMPIGNETDTTEIIKRAFADEKNLVFPVTDEKTGVITPCYTTTKTKFEKGAFSVNEPCDANVADPLDIDTVIVPGIAFDKNGGRIGFGKGCYDGFLDKTKAVKIGFCYELQLFDKIPVKEYDIKMDCIITENGIFKCNF